MTPAQDDNSGEVAGDALPPRFDHQSAEAEIYRRWESGGAFAADPARSTRTGGTKSPFTIVMPPPNVTAVLHVGHGLNNTVQDVVMRWRRMAGDEALWVPGTDHAGIATQNVVEKLIAKEGKSRFDIGRSDFVARTTSFVEETGGVILEQLRAIGASADWSRTAYTLTPALSRAVREAFVRLHERGLIYRGHRVIHWCTRCLTSLSDEEAQHNDSEGKLYHIRYPLTPVNEGDEPRWIVVATTRPETLLGDVAVAVNPSDSRYTDLIGRTVTLPVANIEIPIIADEYSDPAFGSGAVKITPAHDANDFEVGKRHALGMPVVINPSGLMEEGADGAGRVPADIRGLDRFAARREIVRRLEEGGFLTKVEQHAHAVRRCYRCETVVEPRLSDQWFVRMQPLAEPALAAVRDRRIRILPERWEAVYINWLEGIRDWNISRQLWWGHRIPVWYCDACGHVAVSRTDVVTCPACGGSVRQDDDVLDTWFSSGLWPFSTLGWPDETPELKAFYPTDLLITAPEILFFWVARMIMTGFAFMGEAPFHTVYLHGTVRDTKHVKMSKSLGNGIDPLDVVSQYGADALRYTMIAGMGLGADTILDHKDLERSFSPGRNFVTKLWNIGRFLLSNVGTEPVLSIDEVDTSLLRATDRWMLGRIRQAVLDCDGALGPARPTVETWPEESLRAGLRLNEYCESARTLVWNELADWYLETLKGRLDAPGQDREIARAVLVHAFDQALRLLHPIVPFVTEALWQRLPEKIRTQPFLATSSWPMTGPEVAGSTDFGVVREVVMAVRQSAAEYNVPPGKALSGFLRPSGDAAAAVLTSESATIAQLCKCTFTLAEPPGGDAATHILSDGTEVILPLAGMIDVERECARLRSELENVDKQLAGLRSRLANDAFVSRAKPEVVEGERRKEIDLSSRREQLNIRISSLCG